MRNWDDFFRRTVNEFSSLLMYGVNNRPLIPADRKKISSYDARFFSDMVTRYVKMGTMEMIYFKTVDLMKDQSLTDKQRFELIWGDIEINFKEAIEDFAKRYDKSGVMGKYDFDEIRKRYEVET